MIKKQLQHREGYNPLIVQEDFIAICVGEKRRSKAIILSLLEQKSLDLLGKEEYVTLSYRQFEQAMYGLCGFNTIVRSLAELENEGLIERRPYTAITPTYQYRLCTEIIQAKLDVLPERNYVGRRNWRPSQTVLHASVTQQFQGKCAYCGTREATTIDHLIPRVRGGFTVQGNLVPACHYCNSSKGATDVREWLQMQSIQPSGLLQQMIAALYGDTGNQEGAISL